MLSADSMCVKVASHAWEYEQIHALNYDTFVDEIPQHPSSEHKKLIDKYHHENTYVICIINEEVVGMIALRDKRPLSLDHKLEKIESFLPPFQSILEYRLLAVKKAYRNTVIFTAIMKKSFELAIDGNYDIAVISGTTSQVRLYTHLGFKPFGTLVGKQDAYYQPMYIDVASALKLQQELLILKPQKETKKEPLLSNYLPGPVPLVDGVINANSAAPISHRSDIFVKDFAKLRKKLCTQVNAENVHIMMGAGTLANDIIAAQLTSLPGRGLVLINGEFGSRIESHCNGAGLNFETISIQEGHTFTLKMLNDAISQIDDLTWIWIVHCETSTGVINDLSMLRGLCQQHNLKLCVDAISSIGACELDLEYVYLSSAVSGKGMGSLPGLAMVFCRQDVFNSERPLPRFFDLSYYETKNGIPFTISSNAVYALNAALTNSAWPNRFIKFRQWSEKLRVELEKMGMTILADASCRAPHVTTVTLPDSIPSLVLGKELDKQGVLVSYLSEYLVDKNRIQICFMGGSKKPESVFLNGLRDALTRSRIEEPCNES